MLKTVGVLAFGVLVLTGLALAAPQKDTFDLTANLRARSEVPKATGVPVGAVGLFTGKAVEQANDSAKLTWRLTFSKLSGRAAAAHIHVGKPGKAGGVMLPLCGPCRNGQRGAATITHAQLRTIRAGGTYVNVHTAKNAAGEIRGQVKSSGATVSSDPSPSPEPPPYP
ncbi:MAG TPA: CHRD domain-containing protein [Gaiellaceae bacterium]|nr:CHRD domain-containing protein [Gaiellaceae bacterium]